MMKLFFILPAVLLVVAVIWYKKKTAGHKISVACSKKDHRCLIGEKVEFRISSNRKEQITVRISMDGEKELLQKTVVPPAKLSVSIDEPGFIHCEAVSGELTSRCGVGVEPEKLEPYLPKPADFDEFWDNALEEFKALPLDLKTEQCESRNGFDVYRWDCANVNGKRAYAMFAVPQQRKGKVPLVVQFGGGEAYIHEGSCGRAEQVCKNMKRPCAILFFHLPPYPPAKNSDDAKVLHKKFLEELGLQRYIFIGMDKRETFYGYSAIAGCLRLLNAAAEHPDIDRNNIVYYGASHGGSYGLYLAACSDLLKAAFCGVPSFCDMSAVFGGRKTISSPIYKEYSETVRYFDCAYFADRIKIPVFCSAGFIDTSCPPSGIYAMYNQLKCPKQMYDKIRHGHGGGPKEYTKLPNTWLREQLDK